MTESQETPSSESFTKEELKRALKAFKKRLKLTRADDGVFAIWSSVSSDVFECTLAEMFSDVKVETIHWRNKPIDQRQRDDLFLARR